MFHRILISFDGSEHAERALSQAIDLAEGSNAKLTIMTAVPRPSAWAYAGNGGSAAKPLAEMFEREFEEILERAVAEVPDDIPVTKILTREPIKDALIKELEQGGHDLLVMGSRGLGAVSGVVLGSVSHHALQHSPVPVLVVHVPHEAAKKDPAGAAAA